MAFDSVTVPDLGQSGYMILMEDGQKFSDACSFMTTCLQGARAAFHDIKENKLSQAQVYYHLLDLEGRDSFKAAFLEQLVKVIANNLTLHASDELASIISSCQNRSFFDNISGLRFYTNYPIGRKGKHSSF